LCFAAASPTPQQQWLTSWLLRIDKSATFPQFTKTTSKQRSGSQPYTRSMSWKPLYKQQPSGLKSTHLGGRQVENHAQLSHSAQSPRDPRALSLTSLNTSSPMSNKLQTRCSPVQHLQQHKLVPSKVSLSEKPPLTLTSVPV